MAFWHNRELVIIILSSIIDIAQTVPNQRFMLEYDLTYNRVPLFCWRDIVTAYRGVYDGRMVRAEVEAGQLPSPLCVAATTQILTLILLHQPPPSKPPLPPPTSRHLTQSSRDNFKSISSMQY
jgi:hypothetical protein